MLPNKRILIVDDEEDIRFVLAQSIELLGSDYQVLTVPDGFAALIRLQEQPFDLVMTDFHMPGMNGLELVEIMAQIAPNLPVVLIKNWVSSPSNSAATTFFITSSMIDSLKVS